METEIRRECFQSARPGDVHTSWLNGIPFNTHTHTHTHTLAITTLKKTSNGDEHTKTKREQTKQKCVRTHIECVLCFLFLSLHLSLCVFFFIIFSNFLDVFLLFVFLNQLSLLLVLRRIHFPQFPFIWF